MILFSQSMSPDRHDDALWSTFELTPMISYNFWRSISLANYLKRLKEQKQTKTYKTIQNKNNTTQHNTIQHNTTQNNQTKQPKNKQTNKTNKQTNKKTTTTKQKNKALWHRGADRPGCSRACRQRLKGLDGMEHTSFSSVFSNEITIN